MSYLHQFEYVEIHDDDGHFFFFRPESLFFWQIWSKNENWLSKLKFDI